MLCLTFYVVSEYKDSGSHAHMTGMLLIEPSLPSHHGKLFMNYQILAYLE